MQKYFLAVDIGASSGRHMLAHLENGKIVIEEVHRFDNNVTDKNGRLTWDTVRLISEIKAGLKKCGERGTPPSYMGIDTWGVDYVLLDGELNMIGEAMAYRDSRTEGMDAAMAPMFDDSALFARTGIQKHNFNTIYQIYSQKLNEPGLLDKAEHFLFITNFFNFLLTGKIANEYTMGSTSGMLKCGTDQWDIELLQTLGIKTGMFGRIYQPGAVIGGLSPQVREEIGFDVQVLLPCCHDTGSAVVALPGNDEDRVFISSGTWSLLGAEMAQTDNSEAANQAGYTNEGGYQMRHRFLKNIMGLWMIQSVRRELDKKYSFDDLEQMARSASDFPVVVDVTNEDFTYPESMIAEVKRQCVLAGGPEPKDIPEVMACIYNSLSSCYRDSINDLEKLTGKTYPVVNIIGGGSKDGYLCELTAQKTGRTVYVGPSEATSIGNLAVQMITAGEISGLSEAREIIKNSFEIKKY